MSRPAWLLLAVALLAAGCYSQSGGGPENVAAASSFHSQASALCESLGGEPYALDLDLYESEISAQLGCWWKAGAGRKPVEAGRERFRPDYAEETP